jgi:hypothetical protein
MMKTRWVAMLVAGFCASAQADQVTYDLNTAGDLTDAFHTPYTGTTVSQSTTGGLDGSGSVNFKSGSGNQAWFSNAAYSPLAAGGSLSDSLYFQYSGSASTTSIKLGFATDPNSAVNGYAMPSSGSYAYFGVFWTGSLNSEVYSSAGYITSSPGTSGSLVAGNWYQMEFGMELVDSTTSTFEFSWALKNSDSSGGLGTTLFSGTQQKVFAALNTTLYAYIGMENPTSTASYSAIDNISLTSTAQVPEPASAMMLVFGAGVGLVIHRVRRSAMRR